MLDIANYYIVFQSLKWCYIVKKLVFVEQLTKKNTMTDVCFMLYNFDPHHSIEYLLNVLQHLHVQKDMCLFLKTFFKRIIFAF